MRREQPLSTRVVRAGTIGFAILVATSSASLAEEIRLQGGDVINGELVSVTADVIMIKHPALGDMSIPRSQVIGIDGADPASLDAAPATVTAPLPPVKPPSKWKSHLTLGASGAFGNTDTQSLAVTVTSLYETAARKLALDTGYFYGATDGDRTESRFTAGAIHDWLLPDSRWSIFASGRYDYDDFKSWDHRLGLYGGLGYHLIDRETFDVTGRIGAGAIKEWGSANDDVRPEGLLGATAEWQISEKQKFVATSTYYPNLEDFNQFRWVSSANWTALLDDETNLSLSIGLQHEYESQVDAGQEHSDFRIIAGLQIDF